MEMEFTLKPKKLLILTTKFLSSDGVKMINLEKNFGTEETLGELIGELMDTF